MLFHSLLVISLSFTQVAFSQEKNISSSKTYGDILEYRVATTPGGQIHNAVGNFIIAEYYNIMGGSDAKLNEIQYAQLEASTAEFRSHLQTFNKEYSGDFSESGGILYNNTRKAIESTIGDLPVSKKAAVVIPLVKLGVGASFDYYEKNRNLKLSMEAGEKLSSMAGVDIHRIGDGLHALASVDPNAAKLIDKVFKPLLKGSVNSSDIELLQSNIDIKQTQESLKIQQDLKSGVITLIQAQEQTKELAKKILTETKEQMAIVIKNQNEMKDRQVITDKANAIRQNAAEQRMAIAAFSQLGTLLEVDPKFVNGVSTIASATVMINEISQLASINMISGLALGTGYLQAGMMVANLFMKQGPSADQMILEQLAEIRKEIRELKQMVAEGFQAMDKRFTELFIMSAKNFEIIGQDVKDIKRISIQLREDLQVFKSQTLDIHFANLNKDYNESMRDCLPQKYRFSESQNKKLSKQSYKDCQDIILEQALISTPAHLQASKENKDLSLDDSFFEIGLYFQQNLDRNQLGPFLSTNVENAQSLKIQLSQGNIPPLQSIKSLSNGIQELISLAARQKTIPNKEQLYLLKESALNIKKFLAEMVGYPVENGYRLDVNFISEVLDNPEKGYRKNAKILAKQLTENILLNKVADRFHPEKSSLQNFNDLNNEFKYDFKFDGLCDNKVTATYQHIVPKKFFVNGFRHTNKDLPEELYKKFATFEYTGKNSDFIIDASILKKIKIPQVYKMAQLMNGGQFHACIKTLHMPVLSIFDQTKTKLSMNGIWTFPPERIYTYRAEITLKITFESFDDPRVGDHQSKKLISEPKIQFPQKTIKQRKRKKLYSNMFNSIWNTKMTGATGMDYFGTKYMAESASVNDLIRNLDGMERYYNKVRHEFIRSNFANKPPNILTNSNNISDLYKNLSSALYLGAPALWNDKSLSSLFQGPEALLHPLELEELIIQGKGFDELATLIDQRVDRAIKLLQGLEETTYEVSHPTLDLNMLLLDVMH